MMEEETFNLEQELAERILVEIVNLEKLEPGSKEHSALTEDITKMYRALLEAQQIDVDIAKNNAKLNQEKEFFEAEQEAKKAQADKDMEQQKKQATIDTVLKCLGIGVNVIGVVLPLAAYGVMFQQGLDFEKNGCFTSGMFRNLLGKIKPNKVD